MSSASKSRLLLSSPKADTTRNFHSNFSPKPALGINPVESLAYHKDYMKQHSPTNRDSQKISHFLPKGTHSPIHYKTKRPVEIADLGESERLGLSSTIPASYEARASHAYEFGNSQNLANGSGPFLSTRAGHSNNGEGLLDVDGENNNFSYRTAYSGPKANTNNASYLAEKVYSMKLKGPGLMGSIMPLSKSRSPTNMPLSTKNVMSTPNKSGFREADSYNHSSVTAKYNSEMNNTSSMLNKKPGTESNKSIGKGYTERKAINSTTLQDNQLKRDHSWSKIKKTTPTPTATAQRNSDKKTPVVAEKSKPTTVRIPYSPNIHKARETTSNNSQQGMLKSKLEVLVERINTVLWHSNQRTKRSVFVLLMEKWQQSEQKLAKHLDRKEIVLKAKCFCLWQEFLLEINLERQKVQQEKAEEMKVSLADMFHDRKLLRKTFTLLRMANEILPKTLSDSRIHLKSAKNLRNPSISLQKSPTAQSRSIPTTAASATAIKGHTPQPKSKALLPKQKSISEKKATVSPTPAPTQKATAKPVLPPSKVQVPFDLRSKSVGKVLKGALSTTPKSQTSQAVDAKLNSSVESPVGKETSINYSRNGKSAIRVYEHSEIEETTEFSQSPKKVSKEDVGTAGDIDASLGCGTLGEGFEKGREAFDFILAEILHTSESPKDLAKAASSKTVNQEGLEEIDCEEDIPKIVIARSEVLKNSRGSSPPKGTKNNFMLKLDAVAKTAREYNTPTKSSRNTPKKQQQSLTTRTLLEEPKGVRSTSKRKSELLVTSPKSPKRTISTRVKTEEDQEVSAIDKINLEKAINYRRKRLLQIPFVWLLAAAAQTREEMEEKNIMAEINYQNSLKIKSLSGLLEHFVQAFKQNQLYKQYADANLLKLCFTKWSQQVVPQVKKSIPSETYDSEEDNYTEIVDRFRFIVLAEKAIRQWKEFTASSKKPVTVQKSRRY